MGRADVRLTVHELRQASRGRIVGRTTTGWEGREDQKIERGSSVLVLHPWAIPAVPSLMRTMMG